tara:strand:- start:129 stop:395 length:267 start_codon:yes stop_codon:yes gene_type:complete
MPKKNSIPRTVTVTLQTSLVLAILRAQRDTYMATQNRQSEVQIALDLMSEICADGDLEWMIEKELKEQGIGMKLVADVFRMEEEEGEV